MHEEDLHKYQREMLLIQGLPNVILGSVNSDLVEFLGEVKYPSKIHAFYGMLVEELNKDPQRQDVTIYAQATFADAEDHWTYLSFFEQELGALQARANDQFLGLFPYKLKATSPVAYAFQKLEGMELMQYVARQRFN